MTLASDATGGVSVTAATVHHDGQGKVQALRFTHERPPTAMATAIGSHEVGAD